VRTFVRVLLETLVKCVWLCVLGWFAYWSYMRGGWGRVFAVVIVAGWVVNVFVILCAVYGVAKAIKERRQARGA